LGDRLAVGRQILDLAAQVRSLVPQPIFSVPFFSSNHLEIPQKISLRHLLLPEFMLGMQAIDLEKNLNDLLEEGMR
jgi:hypothetical protein